jgi:hypothetical protein
MFKAGDEIIGKTEKFPKATYPAWALRVSEVKDGIVSAAPLGGGFLKKIPLDKAAEGFRLVTDEERDAGLAWKADKFDIEGGPSFAGWHRGDNWNGWACPYFEKAEADRVLAEMGNGWEVAKFDAEKDAYVFLSEGCREDEQDVFKGEDVEINGKKMHLYPVGAYCWIWTLS